MNNSIKNLKKDNDKLFCSYCSDGQIQLQESEIAFAFKMKDRWVVVCKKESCIATHNKRFNVNE